MTQGEFINAKLPLQEEYLGKYREIYDRLQCCQGVIKSIVLITLA